MNYIRTVPRWFPESFMVISSVGSEIWARVHTSGSSNTQYQVHGEKYISRTRFFPDMRFSQDDSRHFVLSISAIKSAYSMVRFSAKCQKPHFLAHICNFWMIQNFWPKKGSVTFFLLSISTLKGLIFAGIKFRGDLISRAKWPRNPRNFITAKILKIDFREIKSPRKLETKPILENSLEITRNRIQNIEISGFFFCKIREIKYPRKLWSLKIRENKSSRKLENANSAKSAKFNPREN